MSTPSELKNALIPNFVPILLKSVVSFATEGVCSDTMAPEKKPYNKLKTTRPATESLIAIQQKDRMPAVPVHVQRISSGRPNTSAMVDGTILPKADPADMIGSM